MTAKLTHRLDTWMSPDIVHAIEMIANETDQTQSAVVRFLIITALSSLGRMPQRPSRDAHAHEAVA